MNWKVTALIAVVPLAFVLGYLLQVYLADDSRPLPEPVVETRPQQPNTVVREPYQPDEQGTYSDQVYVEEDPVVAPPAALDGSDEQVREAVLDFAPAMASWLIPDEQVRKWVLMIDLMADGKLPRRYRPINYPMAAFKVDEKAGMLVSDPVNYERANILLDQVLAIEPERLAKYYRQWRPLLEKAYRELGKPGSFDQRLRLAIEQVLAVKPQREQLALKRPGVFYQYVDPQLEKSGELDRLLWRLGDNNTQRLQAYLAKLAAVL